VTAGRAVRVLVEREDGVLVARMHRPQKRGAADLDTYAQLEEALATPADAYVLTGDGRDFSAGDDVGMFRFADRAAASAFLVEVTRLFALVEAVPRPVVAAVTGYALGFGFELALVSDAVVATPDAVFGLPEITHGAVPPNALGRGVDVLGRGWVRHLALSGRRTLSGTEAHEAGLVAELHPAQDLVAAAVALARDLAAAPDFAAGKLLLTLDAERAYRTGLLVMPAIMASASVTASGRRYAPGSRA